MSAPGIDALRVTVAVGFARVLRGHGVRVSPHEVIETQQVLTALGSTDPATLRAGLRAATTKYHYEQAGFELAFDEFFLDHSPAESAARQHAADDRAHGDLPAGELDLTDDPGSGYTDHNPNTDEAGDLLEAPDAGSDFNPHRDDDDFSLSTSERDLSVRSGRDTGRRGMTYTVQLRRAGVSTAKELTSPAQTASGELRWDDPAGLLSWLDAINPRSVYADDAGEPGGELSGARLDRLAEAIQTFVDELGARLGEQATEPAQEASGEESERAGYRRAAHELLRRIRGAPRPRPRHGGRGKLDVRRTVRQSLRTDGVPFDVLVRRRVPSRVRLLVVADVSLSVRSITAFALRLAQMLHRMSHRCSVLAFVDSPVNVTDALLRSTGDGALAAVLGAPGLDLDASSDYGRVMAGLLSRHAGLLDARTTVLFVGDGRCNGLPAGTEQLAELRRRVHRVGWITPEQRRYWRQAGCAMAEFAEVCDSVITARDTEELIDRIPELARGL